jgi:hypothetical protein
MAVAKGETSALKVRAKHVVAVRANRVVAERAKRVVAMRAWWQARVEHVYCEAPSHHRLEHHELCDRADIDSDAGWRCHCTTIFLLTAHVTITQ